MLGLHLVWSLWLHTSHESEYIRDFKEGLGSLLKALEEDEFLKKKSPFLEGSRVEEYCRCGCRHISIPCDAHSGTRVTHEG